MNIKYKYITVFLSVYKFLTFWFKSSDLLEPSISFWLRTNKIIVFQYFCFAPFYVEYNY